MAESDRTAKARDDDATRVERKPLREPLSDRPEPPISTSLPTHRSVDDIETQAMAVGVGVIVAASGTVPTDKTPSPTLDERTGTVGSTIGNATVGSGTIGPSRVLGSPLEALAAEEIARTKAFARITIPLSLIVLAVLPFLGGDRVAQLGVAAGMVAIIIASLLLRWALRQDAGYSLARVFAFGSVCVFAGYASIYYFGVFSPATVMIPFGLYFFSVGRSFRGTLGIWLECATLELLLGLSVTFRLIPDRGLVRADGLPVVTRLAIIGLVEMIFLATWLIARASRKELLEAISEHDRAVRGIAQREELLKEARQELEKALEAGGLGRFTDEVLGNFKLGAVLGRGGMGEVYEAVNVQSGKPAAVKLLLGHALGDAGHVRRFMREAKIASSMQVPNVVEVLEVGGLDARVPYIAMERLKGSDLADILRRHRRLPLGTVLTMVRGIGRGLSAARDAGIVHRDIKPRNLFRDERGGGQVWKILDFGVSRIVADQGTLTRDQLVGTPTYMAPEQIASGNVDHRADLYALAVICYRALTGRPAFSGDHVSELLYKVVHSMPAKPSAVARLDTDIDAVLAIGMAKLNDDRFDSAEELAQNLELAGRHLLPESVRKRAEDIVRKHPWSEA